MGRITIFTIDGCPHCLRAKTNLKERGFPYVEINLSSHPSKRSHMLALSDSLTVPQVFFNEKHIGGAVETIALLEQWDKDAAADESNTTTTILERYQKEIESMPDPSDPRLDPPSSDSEVEVIKKEAPPRSEEDSVLLPNESNISVVDLTSRLESSLRRQSKKSSCFGKTYKNSFTANEAIADLQKEFNLNTTQDAIQFGKLLQKRQIICPVVKANDVNFEPSDTVLFRLQKHHTPNILNSFRVWTDRVDPDSLALVIRLKSSLDKINTRSTDKSDGVVDLSTASQDEQYSTFEEEVCELQGVNMAAMDVKTKTAFIINVYNLMISYSQIKVGVPSNNFQRVSYFTTLYTNIGGQNFSFNDLENGILRANRKAPYTLSPMFSKNDPRRSLSLETVDQRIHFGLNCGARSCPPVKKFTALDLEEELRIVALAFCEQDENLLVDDTKYVLHLSTIFNWYRGDFAKSNSKLPQALVGYLRGARKEKLQNMIDNGKKSIKIQFIPYDWSSNVKNGRKYSSANLK